MRALEILVLSVYYCACWSARADMPDDRACVNNIRALDGAKEQLKLDRKLQNGDQVDPNSLTQYFFAAHLPACPAGGTYTLGPVGAEPVCSMKGHSATAVLESLAHAPKPSFPWASFAKRFAFLAVPTFAGYLLIRRLTRS